MNEFKLDLFSHCCCLSPRPPEWIGCGPCTAATFPPFSSIFTSSFSWFVWMAKSESHALVPIAREVWKVNSWCFSVSLVSGNGSALSGGGFFKHRKVVSMLDSHPKIPDIHDVLWVNGHRICGYCCHFWMLFIFLSRSNVERLNEVWWWVYKKSTVNRNKNLYLEWALGII